MLGALKILSELPFINLRNSRKIQSSFTVSQGTLKDSPLPLPNALLYCPAELISACESAACKAPSAPLHQASLPTLLLY